MVKTKREAAGLRDNSPEIVGYVAYYAKFFNHLGMELLNQLLFKESQKLFGHILTMLKKFQGDEVHALIGLTLNNLSCSYKRDGQLEEAQRCLNKALELQEQIRSKEQQENESSVRFEKSPEHTVDQRFESSPKHRNEFALTELNLCAIYSQKGNHMKAKMFAHSSIYKLKKDLDYIQQKMEQLPDPPGS